MPDPAQWTIDVSTQTFEADVIQRSLEVPVVLDFWAEWCEPCRQLTPLLERIAAEHAGKFVLAKVNIEQSPEVAGAFGVQSIPHVVAMRDGQPVDQFVGVLPEPQLREWFTALLPSPAEELFKQGQELEASDPAAAEAKYREAAHLDAGNEAIQVALARVLLAQDRDEESSNIIAAFEESGYLPPEAGAIKSQLELRSAATDVGGIDEARKAVDMNPDDLSLSIQLADALAAARQHQEALDICLDIVRRDKAGVGVAAKETMLKIFDVLGPNSELTGEYRRKLATLLY